MFGINPWTLTALARLRTREPLQIAYTGLSRHLNVRRRQEQSRC